MKTTWWPVGMILLAACPDPLQQDVDGDGFIGAEDCADDDDAVFPGAAEICDGIDNNCDGLVDDEDPVVDLSTERPWFADADGDGFGDPDTTAVACGRPEGHVEDDTDCDDQSADIHPGAPEICNSGVDDDCNGFADDTDPGLDLTKASTFFLDRDGDSFGDASAPVRACLQPAGAVPDDTDCADLRADIRPDAQEVCNGIDDDCDEDVDDDDDSLDLSTRTRFYDDTDGDTFGDPAKPLDACAQPPNHVLDATDCDPSRGDVHPDATEVCNDGVDDNCNGGADDDDPSLDTSTAQTFFVDADGDGYGADLEVLLACELPAVGWSAVDTDCNDEVSWIHPTAPERCNAIDDDCDASTEGEGVWAYDPAADAWTDHTTDFGDGTALAPFTLQTDEDAELHICAGTYFATVEAGDDIDVYGYGAPVLDGGFDENQLEVAVVDAYLLSDVAVSGVTLSNGYVGIDALGTNAVITDVTIEAMQGSHGLVHSVGDLDLIGVSFIDGSAEYALATEDATVTLTDVQFDRNTGTWVASIVGSDVTASEVTLQDNDTLWYGISLNSCTFDIDGFTATSNTSTFGAGLDATSSNGTIVDYTAEGNRATSGAGLRVTSGSVDLTTGVFHDNSASLSVGGGIYLSGGPHSLTSVSVTDNSASSAGGGVFVNSGTVTLTDVTISGNTAVSDGGGLYSQFTEQITLVRTDVVNNTASRGGGIYAFGATSGLGTISIDDGAVSNNAATGQGGGLRLSGSVSSTISDSVLAGNTATAEGGGLYLGGGAHQLTDSLLDDNQALTGAGAYLQSGTSVTCEGDPTATSGFTRNTNTAADADGAAVHMVSRSELNAPDDQQLELSTLDAVSCDFGTAAGGDDNDPSDVLHTEITVDCIDFDPCETTTVDTTTNYDDDATFCVGDC